jgi:hypothetical protein
MISARREVTSLTNPELFFYYIAKFITFFFSSFQDATSSLPAPANLHDHIYLPAVFNFMDGVYSRRPQDL